MGGGARRKVSRRSLQRAALPRRRAVAAHHRAGGADAHRLPGARWLPRYLSGGAALDGLGRLGTEVQPDWPPEYYELTAEPAALRACRGMGDLLVRTFGEAPGQRDIIGAGEHLGMAATAVLEPMCRLYRFTADVRYLEFCRYLVRSYDQPHGPRIVRTLLETGSVYRVANGKAYEMLSNLNGLIDLYRLSADKTLLDAVLRAWEDMVRHQLYRTGTLSAAEHFQPEGQLLTLQASNVGEMCVTVTWLQLNWRLLRLTGEARFGQEIERTVYNHLLAAQDPRTGNVSYYTSWAGPKEFTDALLCCVSSGPRGISLLPKLAWGLEKKALVVNLYTPGRARFEIDGVPIQVISETQFPSDGT